MAWLCIYRGKQTDLEHTHYACKTNMAICHKVCVHVATIHSNLATSALQNIGPVWKALCCMMMGVPVPIQALNNILEEQRLWEQHRVQRSRKENTHKRYKFMHH